MRQPILFLALLPLLAPASAAAQAADPPERTSALVVYGDDPCPKAAADEIVVCARRPEDERYRIPRALRHRGEDLSENSWTSNFAQMEEATRFTRPNSCSPVGTGGQTGCFDAMLRAWSAERRAMRSEAASRP